MRIEELMSKFSTTCGPDETLSQAAQKMQNANCELLPVTAGEGCQSLIGMITDGDIQMAAQLLDRSLEELRVRDAMARKVRVCGPGDSLFDAEEIMLKAGIRHLPVVDESCQLLGVLSLADVAREAERERELLCAQISAAQFGLVVSRIHEPYRVGKPAKAAGPAHALESRGERQAAAG